MARTRFEVKIIGRPRTERRPGVWQSGVLEIDGIESRGAGRDGHGGWEGVSGRMEDMSDRRGWTSPGKERAKRD